MRFRGECSQVLLKTPQNLGNHNWILKKKSPQATSFWTSVFLKSWVRPWAQKHVQTVFSVIYNQTLQKTKPNCRHFTLVVLFTFCFLNLKVLISKALCLSSSQTIEMNFSTQIGSNDPLLLWFSKTQGWNNLPQSPLKP